MVVLPEDVEDSKEATDDVAVRIKRALQALFRAGGHELFIATSVGVVLGGGNGERSGGLLRNADLAMYSAKDGGKDCVVLGQGSPP